MMHSLSGSEKYDLRVPDSPVDHRRFGFVMRPWSHQELRERLAAAGFGHVELGPGAVRAAGDQLFAAARL
jgi:hypothetical protein